MSEKWGESLEKVKFKSSAELINHFNIIWDKFPMSPWDSDNPDKIVIKKIKLLKNIINNLSEDSYILDLGCGGGEFIAMVLNYFQNFKKINLNLVGVDIADKAILKAQKKGIYKELINCRINQTEKFCKYKFSLILINEVLYYENDYIDTLKKILDTCQTQYIYICCNGL
jgi:predicted TPR repeat methyltransferase